MRPNPPIAQCSQDISLESQFLRRSLFGGIVGINSGGQDETFLGSKDVELGEQERGGVDRRFGKEEEEEDGDEDCHTSFHCERSDMRHQVRDVSVASLWKEPLDLPIIMNCHPCKTGYLSPSGNKPYASNPVVAPAKPLPTKKNPFLAASSPRL
jgi:hypothetical protein